jgi:hypothetical protein
MGWLDVPGASCHVSPQPQLKGSTEMAHKRRSLDKEGFNIHFTHLDMLRIETVLKRLSEADGSEIVLISSEENEWLSDAMQLFAPELPAGEYPIGTSKHG